uniref:RPA interacting protein n=1 Tax=Callorhinchus milii TaxID=7868 RepID=A0A4W3IGT8_CALMI|eukprot:gi/632984785/ref/XP_007909317.1/ PREDICTED: RPA-interacting protein [Callorhinchus milii]
MEAARRRQALYKSSPPPWKETYRKRCMERLKNNRAKFLEQYRHVEVDSVRSLNGPLLVQEVMEEEWRALTSQDRALPSFAEVLDMLEDESDLTILEEIQQELIAEEQATREEYEASLRFDEACLNAVIEDFQVNDRLICPVCNGNYMHVTNDCVSCTCGMYIDTWNMTTQQLRAVLERGVTEHSNRCMCQPSFSVADSTDTKPVLLMSCQACDFLSILL